MDRKVLTALGLSLGLYLLWARFIMIPESPEAAKPVAADAAKSADAAKVDPAAPVAPSVAAKPGDPTAPVAAVDPTKPSDPTKPGDPAAPKVRQPAVLSPIDIPGRYHATLSTWGGALHELTLLEPRYKEDTGTGGVVPIDLVSRKDAPLPYAVTFPDSGFKLPVDAEFTLESATASEVHYAWSDDSVRVTKVYTFIPNTYETKLTVTVENKGDKPLPASMQLMLSGWQDPEVKPSLFKPSVVQTEGLCSITKAERQPLEKLVKEPLDLNGAVRVVAIDRKYFVLAAAIVPSGKERCHVTGDKGGRITATLTTGAESIAPLGKHSWEVLAFNGPKIVAELDATKIGGVDAHLADVMNYGITESLARPMLWVLKTIHGAIPNWGVAVILLTLLIKLVTWWPTAQSMKSAAAMARLKPEMDKLREQYGEDKARMNQEVMALYQKHKINPLGGCLPVLIQMPVYIALYSMLGNSVELYHARFGLWINDLTGPDPFFVLPLLTGAVMFLQQKLSPAQVDPSQKTMMTIMPVMFTGMSAFLPSGLTLYILTNTALSMIQQRISTPPKDAASASAPSKKKTSK